MMRLRVLGTVDLRDADGDEIRSVLMQPKRLALLLYLALGRPRGFRRRDTVIGLFWPDQAAERARAALNQAVHVLRRSLGAGVIVSRGADELGVSPDHLACDAWEFEDAIAGDDPARALELYGGELVPGLAPSEAPDFERWLEAERRYLAGRAAAGVQTLSERAEQAGDLDEATTWARRALALSPYNEPALVWLMQLLARKGDRAAAIRVCEEFSERLWNDVELRLSPATRDLLSRIRRDAGQPALPALSAGAASRHTMAPPPRPAATPGDESFPEGSGPFPDRGIEPPPGSHAHRGFRPRRLALVATALVLVAAAGGGAARWLHTRQPRPAVTEATAGPTRVAVLYFDEMDPSQKLRPLADGLTESLIDRLTQVDVLQVVSPNGVRPFRGANVSPDSLRKALNVPLLISGSVGRSGDSVRVMVRLVDAATGSTLRSRVIDRRWDEPFALMDALADQVGQFLRTQLGREIQLTRARQGTSNVAAWELLRRAESMRMEASNEASLGHQSNALSLFELADSLLARAGRGDPSWIRPLLDRAFLAEGRVWRAYAAGDGPAAARKEIDAGMGFIDRALEMQPQSPEAFEARGVLEHLLWLLAPPRGAAADTLVQAAERDLRHAIALDPQRAVAWATLSSISMYTGRIADAKAQAERAYEVDSYLIQGEEVVQRLFLTSFELHQDGDARRYCSEFERRFGHPWEWAYCRLLIMGWADSVANPTRAWKVYDEPSRVDGPAIRAATRPLLAILVAATLARAGLPDSARRVMLAARGAAHGNPEATRFEAAVRLLVGDTAESRRLEGEFLASSPSNPSYSRLSLRSRLFAPIAPAGRRTAKR